MATKQKIKDHLDQEFESITALCNHWNIDRRTFCKHLSNGENIQSIIEYLKSPSKQKRCTKVKDHLGQEYKSITDLCKAYNISTSMYKHRLKIGWNLKDILTTPNTHNKPVDHLGNIYSTQKDMCDAYNVSVTTYVSRLKNGYSIEQALTTPISDTYKVKSIDHLGNEFDTITDMCNFHNIPISTFQHRMKYGYSMKQALTQPIGKNAYRTEIIDPFGNEFKTIIDMLNHYHVKLSTYYTYRYERKYSEIEALRIIPTIHPRMHNKKVTNDLTIQNHISKDYYLCIFHDHEIIMRKNAIITYATNYYKEMNM